MMKTVQKLIAILLSVLLLTCSVAALAEDYKFGTDTAFRPFEYTDETGSLVGIDVELLEIRLNAFLQALKEIR